MRISCLLLFIIIVANGCGTHYLINASKGFKIKPDDKFIIRLTDTDFVVDEAATNSTTQLLHKYQHQVMTVHDFDSINYRYILHLNDNWEPSSEKLRRLHIYADYDYLLVGGFSEKSFNFYSYHKRTEREIAMNLNFNEESVVEFRYYLYSIRNQQLVLTIFVRKTAKGRAITHLAFGSRILDKALKKLGKYLQ